MISGGELTAFVIDANLNQGVDTGAGVPPGTLRELTNLRKNKDGQLKKRTGYQGTAAVVTARPTVRGFDHGGLSVNISDHYINAYGEAMDTHFAADTVPCWTLDKSTQIAGDTSGVYTNANEAGDTDNAGFKLYPSVACGGGVVAHVWIWKQFANQQTVPGPDPSPPLQDRHGVYLLVRDERSGAVLRGPERISSTATGTDIYDMARIVYVGGSFWIAWSKIEKYGNPPAGTGTIYTLCKTAAQLASTTVFGAGTAQKTDLACKGIVAAADKQANWDLCAGGTTATPKAFIAYHRDNAGTYTIDVFDISTSNTTSATHSIASGASRAISCANKVDSGYIWVAYAREAATPTVRVTMVATSLATSNSVDLLTTGLIPIVSTGVVPSATTSTDAHVVATYQEPVAPRCTGIIWRAAQSAAGVPATSGDTKACTDVALVSQPFHNGSDYFVFVETGRPQENWAGAPDPDNPVLVNEVALSSTMLINLTRFGGTSYTSTSFQTLAPHLRIQAGRTYFGQYADYWVDAAFATMHAPQKVTRGSVDTDQYIWDGTIALAVTPNTTEYTHNMGIGASGIVEHRIRNVVAAKSAAHVASESHGIVLTSGGGMLNSWDGQQLTEIGFCQPPRIDYVTDSGTTGTGITAGNYQWAVVYEYTDSTGLIHRSLPRFTASTAVTVNHIMTIRARTLKVTRKQDADRTTRGTVTAVVPDTNVQVVLYRSGEGPTAIFYRTASTVNNPAVDTIDINDSGANADIETGQILYTSSDELSNECPPPATHAVEFNNRIAMIDAEYGDRILFSKPLRQGLGPSFSGLLETYVKGIGRLTALAAMDGTLYAFSATSIAVAAYGDGQDALGTGAWPQPQIISRAAGCIDARALCVTQEGIVFFSRSGDANLSRVECWLLPRGGGNPINIGLKVHGFLSGSTSFIDSYVKHVTSCVNWPDEGRVAATLLYADNTTWQIEYDYIHRGADGQGVWNAVRSRADTAYGVSCSWVSGGRHWLGVSTANGYVFRSVANLYDDLDYTGATSNYVDWTVETHNIKLGSLLPRGKLNFVNVRFLCYAATNVRMTLTGDASGALTGDFALSSAGILRTEWQPPVRRDDTGGGVTLRIAGRYVAQALGTQDAIPTIVNIDYIPIRGIVRPTATERI